MQYKSSLIIHKQTLPFLNISLFLNDIKPIKSITIENTSEIETSQIELKITSDLPCIETFNYIVANLPAKGNIRIPLDNLKLNREFLNKLSETERANFTIEVFEDKILSNKETITINLHPLEHFGGFQVLPELIAAYITPNHPYIYHIKRNAIDILESQGLKTAFEGYHSKDTERVYQVMSAIYSAIQNEGIAYSALPPGYEETGQRLRLINTIQQEKFGNCIDISLLFAACLEAVGLNPILIIVRGHAFVGCWLQDNKFAEIINEDKAAITKRISKGIYEMAAIEATSLCKGNNIKFSDALNEGEAQLVEKEDFLMAIDIKRARTQRIRPLPLLTKESGTYLDEESIIETEKINYENSFNIGTVYQDELLQGNQPKTKQKIWERKLLDLSLRNNLLNIHFTRNMLQLVDIDISKLEDTLSDGKSFSIMPSQNAEVLHKYNLFNQPLHPSSQLYQIANDELKQNRLYTYYHQQDLDNILNNIYKNAKQSIEENGSSTLYLAVGLLKWYDPKTPEQPRLSPILLIPVEISRRSVNSKFTLKSREEETMINITLVEFLRQQYELNLESLEQLPTDDKGVDVAKVMGVLRKAILDLKGWDVLEQIVLGNFSFSKLILWKDIVLNQDALIKNDMVRSLVEGKLVTYENQVTNAVYDIDSINSESIILPIPSDVSQTEAVIAAQKGLSFVLHGPPGTGKSQTITNIIADALYHGKRVLFVAAKKAALDVVHKRLEQIGLAPFTLELHSNKSKKSDVLNQLAKSISTKNFLVNGDFIYESQRLDNAKKSISNYVNLLHKKQKVGWSLYQSISAIKDNSDNFSNKILIPETTLQQLEPSLWQKWIDWLPQFQSIIKLITHPSENSLTEFNIPRYSNTINDEILKCTQSLIELLPELQFKSEAIAAELDFPYSIQSKSEWECFVLLISELQHIPDISFELIQYLIEKENIIEYKEWTKTYSSYLNIIGLILKDYSRNILSEKISEKEIEWKKAQQKWLVQKWFQKRNIKKQLSIFKKTPFSNDSELETLFNNYNEYQALQTILNQSSFVNVQNSLKHLFKGEQTDLLDIENKVLMIQKLDSLLNFWEFKGLSKLVQIWQDKNFKYTNDIKLKGNVAMLNFIKISDEFNSQINCYKSLTGISFKNIGNWNIETKIQLQRIKTHLPQLKTWSNYLHLCNEGSELSLDWLIQSFNSKICSEENLTNYFYDNVHHSIASQIISQHETLSLFNTDLFESKIEQYKKIAKDFQTITIDELQNKLAAQLHQNSDEIIQSSEISFLQRAIRNKGRGLSIRKLFDQIPKLLPRISPCMLMSPISVAQYFDMNTNHFDIVIFDEASQLPTCEAVSALARAKQSIIVGDPKQMPPTSFFNSVKVDEENIEIEDLESILDDCLSISVPSKYLLRHYRSKHESLIAFSNANYYENKLLTFPSFDDLNRKVIHHPIKGFYDKGKTGTNKFEADEIVEFIKLHYGDSQKRKLSLGVVTFSQKQQSLIEDKLQKLFISNPNLEEFANDTIEPLFVKNLENVQGDERDIILFSVCYAHDEMGNMSMNFGPLNREGGWRRLNVAVTRARCEMHVFVTFKTDQIDLNRTNSEGLVGLKAFLQFAEKGQLALRNVNISEGIKKEHLSATISKKLQEKGLSVKCNIGTSDFKIDIGIINVKKPQEFILGIIVDGYYYYNAHTTNDRELVMPSVLRSLGWNIYRIWSIDWYENSNDIIDKIVQMVINFEAQPKLIESELTETITNVETTKVMSEVYLPNSLETKQKIYKSLSLNPVYYANSEMIYEFQNRNILKEQVKALIEVESPISKSLIFKKIAHTWNVKHTGVRFENHIDEIIKEMNILETNHHQPFYWANNITLDYYRSNDIEKRNIEDIAPEEMLVALNEILTINLSIDKEELISYLLRKFGFAKKSNQNVILIQYIIDFAAKTGNVKNEDGRVEISNK